jgi:ABC-type iron transport system FetAB ATPase subunit
MHLASPRPALSPVLDLEAITEGPRIAVENVYRSIGGRTIISDISFSLHRGEILFIRGPSGVGKTLLLRCLSALDPLDSGLLTLDGRTPDQIGHPNWRARVTYVHQQRVTHKGTPSEWYFAAQHLKAQRGRPRGDLPALIHELGLEQAVLNQPWSELSVSEPQNC